MRSIRPVLAWRAKARSGTAYVAGAIGPLGLRIEPWGRMGRDEAEAYFREQAQALVDGGVDLFILETFRDLNEIRAAIAAVRSVCALPIVAQMTIEDDGNTLDGTAPEQFAPSLQESGANLIGLNCSIGPAHMLETLERMTASTTVAAVGAAQRRTAPRCGRANDLPDVTRVHGVVRAALRRAARSAGRWMLRHDAGSHRSDQSGSEQSERPVIHQAFESSARRWRVTRACSFAG